jgi:hypothetical protein
VQRSGRGIRRGALVAAAILLLCTFRSPIGVDLRVDGAGGHAVLKLGMASLRIAFDSGRACPKSNTCRAAIDTPSQEMRLAWQLRGQGA